MKKWLMVSFLMLTNATFAAGCGNKNDVLHSIPTNNNSAIPSTQDTGPGLPKQSTQKKNHQPQQENQ